MKGQNRITGKIEGFSRVRDFMAMYYLFLGIKKGRLNSRPLFMSVHVLMPSPNVPFLSL